MRIENFIMRISSIYKSIKNQDFMPSIFKSVVYIWLKKLKKEPIIVNHIY